MTLDHITSSEEEEMKATEPVEVGQRYRDETGYLVDVIQVRPNGDA
jgi:hypothetical protein